MEIKNVQLDESGNDKADDEMDVSDEDEPSKKKAKIEATNEEKNNLKEENESLRCQMEAYKNEVEVIKVDFKKELDDKEKQFKMLQQTLQGMQQQLIEAKRKQAEEEARVKELQLKIKQIENKQSNDKDVITLDDNESNQTETTIELAADIQRINECDAKLVGIISAFLNVHPFGAGLDYIWSYVSKLETNLRPADIESLMNRFPTVFKQELVGIGANIERRWIFNAFNSVTQPSS